MYTSVVREKKRGYGISKKEWKGEWGGAVLVGWTMMSAERSGSVEELFRVSTARRSEATMTVYRALSSVAKDGDGGTPRRCGGRRAEGKGRKGQKGGMRRM
jgi:hypothetical protein